MATRSLLLGFQALLLATVAFATGCADPGTANVGSSEGPDDQLTFNRDIAPIVFAHCATCHRPGEAGPFDLLCYQDVAKRARQIVEVTESRYMPPWLPTGGDHPFRGSRRLSEEQIAAFAQWFRTGAAEGDAADLPPPPQWPHGWQLGEPDLVLQMQSAFEVPAGGSDVFRNFVVPVEIPQSKYVAAFEFRPGNPRLVHHADLRTDATPGSRELDAMDVEPGFDGIFGGAALAPGGVFLGWTPGRVPAPPDPDVAWPLRVGTDLIMQLHLQPTGKPESIQSSIGVYFSEHPPRLFPFAISIGCRFFNIPPGAKDYAVKRSYTLPVDAHVASIYPHAHYLGKRIRGTATLPDGQRTVLIEIEDWDFNWQDQYTYGEPVFLPQGTTVTMEFVYDNSAENVRNPSHPPQRVLYGPNSINEMGELMLQLTLRRSEDVETLADDYFALQTKETIRDYESTLAVDPENVDAIHELGAWHAAQEDYETASEHFQRELGLREDGPRKAKALIYMAFSLQKRGLSDEAEQAVRRAIDMEPRLPRSYFALGDLLAGRGALSEAVDQYEQGLRLDPQRVEVLEKAAMLLLRQKKLQRAATTYEKILDIDPDHFDAHFNLGNLLLLEKKAIVASYHYEQAIRLRPGVAQAHKQLGMIYGMQGDLERAAERLQRAIELEDDLADAHYNLGMVRMQQGRDADAARHFRRRLTAPRPSLNVSLNLAWILATSPQEGVLCPEEAVELAEQCAEQTESREPYVLDRLAAAYAAAGRFQQASDTAAKALSLARERGQSALSREIESRLELYRQGRPYRRGANGD